MSARYAALVAMAQTNVQKSATSQKNEKNLGVADIRISNFDVLRLLFYNPYLFKNRVVGEVDLSHLLPAFRSETELSINKRFLTTQNKNLILKNLQFGFRADWTPVMPPVGATPPNFLIGPVAIKKLVKGSQMRLKKGGR